MNNERKRTPFKYLFPLLAGILCICTLGFICVQFASKTWYCINEKNFPDSQFREYLKDQPYGKDGIITHKEIAAIEWMGPSSQDIKDMSGVEIFTELRVLICDYNELTSLNTSHFHKLEHLSCSYNKLTNLDLTNNRELISLYCTGNYIENLNLTYNTKLVTIQVK